MTTDDGYEAWLRANPPPDPQELVSKHGGYDRITPEAWAEYDHAMAAWQARRRTRSEGSEDLPHSERVDPEAHCICGLPGVVSRPRKKGRPGGPIWRCEQHRDRWPDYAAEVYDDAADFAGSLNDCYRAVRERVVAGGKTWEPP